MQRISAISYLVPTCLSSTLQPYAPLRSCRSGPYCESIPRGSGAAQCDVCQLSLLFLFLDSTTTHLIEAGRAHKQAKDQRARHIHEEYELEHVLPTESLENMSRHQRGDHARERGERVPHSHHRACIANSQIEVVGLEPCAVQRRPCLGDDEKRRDPRAVARNVCTCEHARAKAEESRTREPPAELEQREPR